MTVKHHKKMTDDGFQSLGMMGEAMDAPEEGTPTAGEWHVFAEPGDRGDTIMAIDMATGRRRVVAQGVRSRDDANILAAAKELLAAAETVYRDFDLQIHGKPAPGYQEHWRALCAAIAMAKGGAR